MKQLSELAQAKESVNTLVGLTSAFETIASLKISQVRDQAQQSQKFFAEIWRIYTQIRVDEMFHFGRRGVHHKVIPKELMILITSSGGFSGDIDVRLVEKAMKAYSPDKNDIIIIGHHGLVLLQQRNVIPKRSFQLPKQDSDITAGPLVDEVQQYQSTVVYYEAYQSLMSQSIETINLSSAVAERGKNIQPGPEEISELNYIFEPSTEALVNHLESSMLQIAISQTILESKLAQYASRFKAMTVANDRAKDTLNELSWLYNRGKRHIKDERLKEIINGLRGSKRAQGELQ